MVSEVDVPLALPKIVLGGNVFGWSLDEASSCDLLDAAADSGLTCIDTADVYSFWGAGNRGGESETIIGNWFKRRGRRDDVLLHTKGGAPGAPGELAEANLTAAYLARAVEGSLRRLQTDYIDLYYVHYDDTVTPAEETLSCFQRLIEQGKIRAIAASNYAPGRLVDALDIAVSQGLPRFSGFQAHYNLHDRDAETTLLPLCREHGVKVLSYFSLAQGFLSGKYRSVADLSKSTVRGTDVAGYLTPRGQRILDALESVAAYHNASCTQVALAWLVAKPGVAAAVASATSRKQLGELAAARELKLDPGSIVALDTASGPV